MSARPTLAQLVDAAGITPLALTGGDPPVLGVSIDSRAVSVGDVFLALRGARHDGTRFVPQALERGAVAVLAAAERPAGLEDAIGWVQVEHDRPAAGLLARECLGRPDESLTLVGITGTNGKTTVAHLVESIAAAAGLAAGRIGTTGFHYTGRESAGTLTTPEAPELYRLLAEMRDAGVELVAMEVSSHALALSRVEGARFDVAAFLNLTRDHLDFHGSQDAYFESKATLFDRLTPQQNAVLPADDPWAERLAERTAGRVLRFGRSAAAQVRLSDERCSVDGSRARLHTPAGSFEISTPLAGRFNLDNAAAAAACAVALGLQPEAIVEGLRRLRRVPGRMQRIDRGQPFTVLVDYAHTDDALERLLTHVRALTDGKLLLVFGCGGDRDRGKRPAMGRAAANGADEIWLTSDNPRSEDPHAILRDVEAGLREAGAGPERSHVEVDRARAVAAAIAQASAGDVVVIAGKGHETAQEIDGRFVELDDRVLAAAALARRGWNEDERAGA